MHLLRNTIFYLLISISLLNIFNFLWCPPLTFHLKVEIIITTFLKNSPCIAQVCYPVTSVALARWPLYNCMLCFPTLSSVFVFSSCHAVSSYWKVSSFTFVTDLLTCSTKTSSWFSRPSANSPLAISPQDKTSLTTFQGPDLAHKIWDFTGSRSLLALLCTLVSLSNPLTHLVSKTIVSSGCWIFLTSKTCITDRPVCPVSLFQSVGQLSSPQACKSVPFVPVLLFGEQKNLIETKSEWDHSPENYTSFHSFLLFLPFKLCTHII